MANRTFEGLKRFRRSRWPYALLVVYGVGMIVAGAIQVASTGVDVLDSHALTGIIVVLVFGSRLAWMTFRRSR